MTLLMNVALIGPARKQEGEKNMDGRATAYSPHAAEGERRVLFEVMQRVLH